MNAALLRPGSGGAPGTRRLRTPRASYPGPLSASSMLWAALFLAAWAVLSALPSAAPRPSTHAPGPIVHFGPTMIPALLSPALPRPTVAPRIAGSGVVVPVGMPDALPGEVPVETPPVFDTGSPGEPPDRGARPALRPRAGWTPVAGGGSERPPARPRSPPATRAARRPPVRADHRAGSRNDVRSARSRCSMPRRPRRCAAGCSGPPLPARTRSRSGSRSRCTSRCTGGDPALAWAWISRARKG